MSETWTYVCTTAELLPGEMKTAFDEVTGAGIVVVNLDGELYALEDRCSHEDFELSAGRVDPVEGSVECVLHGARFDVRDGRALCAPAYEPVAKFPVKVEGGGVWARDDRE
ncbi:non-heme iron oxygenase ferredoxin subunit [Luteimonas wenzhouensis]|uniref:Non-heme iron oxygenase ferredoxin subunit n=1 Tax=Luteimonas wenzhouensis TaxID=2599615 RepID=A0A5C5TTW3_9GAMM|nr:non-heme iron oxygenase ferredoxin subunit [Luteimonas wenzhouensis]NLW96983.1 non-heme iron oxygenase ferredoxin subunit [Xanthomonadaceae bacterium]TWT17631.1 non-heme iron oxygenase ferredoxin subunit [Luteimonas wenzhouensis]